MDTEQFVSKINEYTSTSTPFIFLIDFEMNYPFICRLEEAALKGVFYEIKGRTNFLSKSSCSDRLADRMSSGRNPVSFAQYHKAYDIIQRNLHCGNTYLCNLTFPTEIQAGDEPAENVLADIFQTASADYKLLYKDRFTLFSPECFVKIKDGRISSYPMKGTIDASIPEAEEIILNDKKEFWEHNTIVDLIRNDLSIVSTEVEVTRFRYIDRIKMPDKELLQVSSEITGKLPAGWQNELGDIILKLLPAGSISGAPKKKTVEIIREAEGRDRGYYTGIFGIFDGENLDSGVNIRFLEREGERLLFRSGGGITANSDEAGEYQELQDKVNVPVS
jgi:para-aminobenzoate synthetase component 1